MQQVTAKLDGKNVRVSWKEDDNHERNLLYFVQAYCSGSPMGDEKTTFNNTIIFTKLRLQKDYFFRVWASEGGKRSTAVESPVITLRKYSILSRSVLNFMQCVSQSLYNR